MREQDLHTIVVGSGAAGFSAALRLNRLGIGDLALLTENRMAGTSRNTGSDKQTYYKLSVSGSDPDSVRGMAQNLFEGGCVDGDQALCEAVLLCLGCPDASFLQILLDDLSVRIQVI